MKYTNILKTNLMRATMTLALIVTCATAWAQTRETVNYIDADGNPQSHEATVLTGNEYTLGSYNQTTWYVVNSNITHNGQIGFEGHVNIILADGKTMTVNGGNYNAFSNGQTASNSLTIYGQSGQSGTLTCSSSTDAIYNYFAGSFIVNGGIVNVTGGSSSSKGIYSKNVTINGGTVNANGYFGIYADSGGNLAINGGNVTANGTWGIYGNCNVTLSWKNDTDRIYASRYYGYTISIAEGKYFKDASGNIYCGNVSANSINGKTLQPATQTEGIQYCLGTGNDGSAEHPYTINDANGWNAFCLALEDKDTWNGFSGKIVKLGANITVTRIAGSGSGGNLTANDHPFCGTFDGYGKTLTFNYGSSGSPADENNLAPFRYVNNATIRHLHVAGTIYTKHVHAGGIIGMAYGTTNITDCRSSVNIISSINGDGTHGGIMSCSWTGSTTNITGCLFDGSIQSASGYTTNQCGGFVGWKNATFNVSNSLLTADLSTIATPDGLQYPSATFVRHGVASDITNCYYSTVFGIPQGKQRYSIIAGENVTVAFSGTANEYQTSGITAYKDGNTQLPGLKYGDVLYAGNEEIVSLTLSHSNLTGYTFTGYTVDYGELSGNDTDGYILTMPDNDVMITAEYCAIPANLHIVGEIGKNSVTVGWDNVSGEVFEYAMVSGHNINLTTVTYDGTTTNSEMTWNNMILDSDYTVVLRKQCSIDHYSQAVALEIHTDVSCRVPTAMTCVESTTNSATLQWTENGSATAWQICLNNDEANLIDVDENDLVNGTYTLNNLTHSTTYTVKVRANCGGNDGNSEWSTSISFATECGVVVVDAAHPFTEGFEGEDFPPLCWEKISLGEDWERSTGYRHSGSASAYSDWHGDKYLVIPDIQLPNNGTAQLTFWSLYGYLDDYGKSSVVLLDGNTETELWALDKSGLGWETWYETTVDLTAYMGQTISLAFKYEGYNAHDWYVDDVVVTATPTFTKDIVGYGDDNTVETGWYLIASPVGNVSATDVTNLANIDDNDGFDLYRFNQAADAEWENWKKEGNHYHFNLESSRGYLYANSQDVTLVFTGTPYNGDGDVQLNKTEGEGIDFPGWNLVGNPFAETAYILDGRSFYTMNGDGSEIIAATDNSIAPMEGVFVIATEDGEIMTFTTTDPQNVNGKGLVLNLSKGASTGSATRGGVIDRAIVRFDGPSTSSGTGGTLPKFQMNPNHTKVYIPQDGNDYAVVRSEGVGEKPVNFKAEKNGTYTLSFNTENVEFSYLHLIDNMTGADIDLLSAGDCGSAPAVTAEGTSYTFEAKTTDYESRFKLVFVVNNNEDGASTGSATFAFYSNGNWIIANPSTGSGSATLQVIDITGRILSSETVNGSVSKSINQPAGVYMIRLINGENVRTQKVVVR